MAPDSAVVDLLKSETLREEEMKAELDEMKKSHEASEQSIIDNIKVFTKSAKELKDDMEKTRNNELIQIQTDKLENMKNEHKDEQKELQEKINKKHQDVLKYTQRSEIIKAQKELIEVLIKKKEGAKGKDGVVGKK